MLPLTSDENDVLHMAAGNIPPVWSNKVCDIRGRLTAIGLIEPHPPFGITEAGRATLREIRPREDGAHYVSADDARSILHARFYNGVSPYDGFDASRYEFDNHGWNGVHQIFEWLLNDRANEIVVDVGVWKGQSTRTMAEIIRRKEGSGIVLAVDTWLGSPEHWNVEDPTLYSSLAIENGYPTIYRQFLANVIKTNLQDYILPIPQTSANAAVILRKLGVFPAVVHIDAAHEYEPVLEDCRLWYAMISPGGAMVGDDYDWPGVKEAVTVFSREIGIRPHIDGVKWVIPKHT